MDHCSQFMRKPLPTLALSYLFALTIAAAPVLICWLPEPVLQGFMPLVTVFGAVAFAVWQRWMNPSPANTVAALFWKASQTRSFRCTATGGLCVSSRLQSVCRVALKAN